MEVEDVAVGAVMRRVTQVLSRYRTSLTLVFLVEARHFFFFFPL